MALHTTTSTASAEPTYHCPCCGSEEIASAGTREVPRCRETGYGGETIDMATCRDCGESFEAGEVEERPAA